MKRHWLYVWLPHPLGFFVTGRLIIYIGETSRIDLRTRQHLSGAWWRWLVIPVPVALPMPRWAARWLERVLVEVTAPAANREYNRGRHLPTMTPGRMLARMAITAAVLAGAGWVWLAR